MKADFSGYATKAGLKCTDGKTIMPDAFKHQDKMRVPLVWQHGHDNPENVLGHVLLENRNDGVYCHAFFNDTPPAIHAATLVKHKDIRALSIWANQLIVRSQQVFHGAIKEVSLVIGGANPGAFIDNITLQHGDGESTTLEDEAIIYTGLEFEHADDDGDDEDDDEDGETVQDVFDSMSDKQKTVVHYMIGEALESAGDTNAEHGDTNNTAEHGDTKKEGTTVTNVFEKNGNKKSADVVLSHDDMKAIFDDAMKNGSFKEALGEYALAHGVTDIETLFPEAKSIDGMTPAWITRRMEWVGGFLGATRKSPFSRIKSQSADLTYEDARAKGYIKGNLKKEQFFAVSARETTPKTVYKKQKLDRDDIIDITDFDIVAWIRQEMRFMLEEEIARAGLIGDGREIDDEDKIDETKIRPIASDDEFYTTQVYVQLTDASSSYNEVIDKVILNRAKLKGSGTPNFYTTEVHIAQFLTLRDLDGRRLYKTLADLAAELRVNAIIAVEVLEDEPDIIGILVNPADYVYGATRGGEVTTFDDFDIDYNQYKYLIETRLCGCLTKYKSAMVIREATGDNALVTPAMPAFVAATGALTITNQTGVVYKHGATVINAAGSPYTVEYGTPWVVDATPASGYAFPSSDDDQWTFTADE